MLKKIKELEENISNLSYQISEFEWFIIDRKRERKQAIFEIIGVVVVSLIFLYFSWIEMPLVLILAFFFGGNSLLKILLNNADIRDTNEIIGVIEETLSNTEKELELEKSYPTTTIIRINSAYSTFKEDIVDGKVIIKEKQGKKMVVVAEKSVEECIAEFKELISPFEIIRAQICQRTDYPGKDIFKWEEITNILKE